MEKRFTATALLFSLGFLFMLILAVGAFFYGVQIGSDRIEAKYSAQMEAEALDEFAVPYQQQDLVSFYHTVFSPYREFQNEWLNTMNKLARSEHVEAEAAFKNLGKLSKRKAEEASAYDMGKSLLLEEAQIQYIRSMQLFQDAAAQAEKAAKTKNDDELYHYIVNDETYLKAVKQSLEAQNSYYLAMQKWAASVDPEIPGEYNAPDLLALDKWQDKPLVVKNSIVSGYLADSSNLYPFFPHDLTSRVDLFIDSGGAAKLKLQSFNALMDLLLSTEAVPSGHFISFKNKLYNDELLPQLPFFLPDMN
ncbi:hypothetical protein [Paenibacillus chungangensis]|uniref:Uncharacterized protein n=1 Tax=Paenibacillus chungangensis TaxID=696535 RepID=A0ABW3HMP3_9BACL